jgi:hypothetical protein
MAYEGLAMQVGDGSCQSLFLLLFERVGVMNLVDGHVCVFVLVCLSRRVRLVRQCS